MLTLGELEYLTTQLQMHIYFLEFISEISDERNGFDHQYALGLVIPPLKEIAEKFEATIETEIHAFSQQTS